jgi:hypothetical protein
VVVDLDQEAPHSIDTTLKREREREREVTKAGNEGKRGERKTESKNELSQLHPFSN